MKLSTELLLLLLTTSCAMVRSVSQTSIPKKRNKVVEAEVTNNIIFLFNFSTTYLNDLTEQLSAQCPNGKVQGILTNDTLITYFPIVFYKERITATGYCND